MNIDKKLVNLSDVTKVAKEKLELITTKFTVQVYISDVYFLASLM